MGVRDALGMTGVQRPEPKVNAEPETPEPEAQLEPETPEPEGGQDGGDVADPGVHEGSRRYHKVQELIERQVGTLNQTWEQRLAQMQTDAQQRTAALEQQLAHTRGQLEAYQKAPPFQSQTPQKDPGELQRLARQQLQAGNIDEYERLNQEAADIRYEAIRRRDREEILAEVQKRIPQQVDPYVSALIGQHPHVAAAGPQVGNGLVELKLRELQLYGHRPGPETLRTAFKMAEDILAARSKGTPAPQFDRSAAGALAAHVPTGRTAGAGEGGGARTEAPKLSQMERNAARARNMTDEEYHLWKTDPQKARTLKRRSA